MAGLFLDEIKLVRRMTIFFTLGEECDVLLLLALVCDRSVSLLRFGQILCLNLYDLTGLCFAPAVVLDDDAFSFDRRQVDNAIVTVLPADLTAVLVDDDVLVFDDLRLVNCIG